MKISARKSTEPEMDDLTGRCGPISLTRRSALLALSATILSPSALAQQREPVIRIQRFHNVRVAVSDLERSAAFYEKLFGPALREQDAVVFRIGGGPEFLALTAVTRDSKPDYLSYGLSVLDFDAGRVRQALADLGVRSAQAVQRGDRPELFLSDANGIKIQLEDAAYGYGSGGKGNISPPVPSAVATSRFQLKSINHVTLTVANGAREVDFYRTAFGLPMHHTQGNVVGFGIGDGRDGAHIAFNGAASNPNVSSGINHACFTIENFDPESVMAVLIDAGLEPIEYGIPALIKPLTCRVRWRQRADNGGGPTSPLGTPELYFNDPDNISIQIQDVSYCGGSGRLGEICP